MVNGPNGWKMNKIRSARSYAGIFLLLGSLHNFCWCKNANNIYFTFYFSPIYLPIQKDFIYQLLMNPVLIKTTANLYEDCLHLKLYQFIYTKIFVDLYDYRPTRYSNYQFFLVIINYIDNLSKRWSFDWWCIWGFGSPYPKAIKRPGNAATAANEHTLTKQYQWE